MSDFINQFPYSDFHELNIDWLIKRTKLIEEELKDLKEQFDQIELLTEEQIREMIKSSIDVNNIAIYHDMDVLKSDITEEYKSYVENRIYQLQIQLQQLKVYIDNQDIYYDDLAKAYANNAIAESKQYTDDQVLSYTMMVNPITGVYEDVRNVVNDIVTYFHTDGALTASEYDALELTAQGYDNYELTAYQYDFEGKNLLT